MEKRIAVFGAGAIGGYVGGQLAEGGFDVTLIDPWPEHIEAIRLNGLCIEGLTREEFICPHPRTLHVTEVQKLAKEKPIDIAFIAVKSYDTEWASLLMSQYLAADGFLVSLQNCMNEARIAAIVGWEKTLGAIPALLSAELYAPGRVRRTVAKGASEHDIFRVGEVHGRITPRLLELASILRKIDTVTVTRNLWGERWSKLCVNGMRNGIGAATGLSGIEIDSDPQLRRFSIGLGGEAVRVGQALGYALEPIRMHDPETLARAAEGDGKAFDRIESEILAAVGANTRSAEQRPSMGQDMRKGRRTEIDFINGLIIEKAKEVGRGAATHEKLLDCVKRVERGEIPADRENLTRLL